MNDEKIAQHLREATSTHRAKDAMNMMIGSLYSEIEGIDNMLMGWGGDAAIDYSDLVDHASRVARLSDAILTIACRVGGFVDE